MTNIQLPKYICWQYYIVITDGVIAKRISSFITTYYKYKTIIDNMLCHLILLWKKNCYLSIDGEDNLFDHIYSIYDNLVNY